MSAATKRKPTEAAVTMDAKPENKLAQMEREAQSVRASLANALVKGDPTTKLREFLVELEAEIAAERRVVAEQQRVAAERSVMAAKSATVDKFEAAHPVVVRMLAEAAERRARRAAAFRI